MGSAAPRAIVPSPARRCASAAWCWPARSTTGCWRTKSARPPWPPRSRSDNSLLRSRGLDVASVRLTSIARDDLALAAVILRRSLRTAGLAPHQDRRPAAAHGGAPAPARHRRSDPHAAQPLERLAEAVAIGDQQRAAEHVRPALPFGDHVVAGVGRDH